MCRRFSVARAAVLSLLHGHASAEAWLGIKGPACAPGACPHACAGLTCCVAVLSQHRPPGNQSRYLRIPELHNLPPFHLTLYLGRGWWEFLSAAGLPSRLGQAFATLFVLRPGFFLFSYFLLTDTWRCGPSYLIGALPDMRANLPDRLHLVRRRLPYLLIILPVTSVRSSSTCHYLR